MGPWPLLHMESQIHTLRPFFSFPFSVPSFFFPFCSTAWFLPLHISRPENTTSVSDEILGDINHSESAHSCRPPAHSCHHNRISIIRNIGGGIRLLEYDLRLIGPSPLGQTKLRPKKQGVRNPDRHIRPYEPLAQIPLAYYRRGNKRKQNETTQLLLTGANIRACASELERESSLRIPALATRSHSDNTTTPTLPRRRSVTCPCMAAAKHRRPFFFQKYAAD